MANPLQSFLAGEAGRRAAERHPLEQAQREVGIERQRQALTQQGQQFDQATSLKGAQLMNQVIGRVKQVQDPNQRLQIFERVRPELQKFGVELPPNLTVDAVTDEGLVPLETGIGQTIQKLTTGQRDVESQAQSIVGSLNEETGKPFTLEEARREITLRGTGIKAKAGTETFRERASKDQKQVDRIASLEKQLAEAKGRGGDIAKGETTTIVEGREAAKGIPLLKRTLSLLDEVKTGGFAAVALKTQQRLGIESADEGELSANLGQAVLGDLRQTFGAAFTEKEGARLERIRANLGRSPAANRRLIAQALKIAENYAEDAMDAAIDRGDTRVVDEIQGFLDLDLGAEEAQKLPPGVKEEDIQHTMRLHGVTREEVLQRIGGQ